MIRYAEEPRFGKRGYEMRLCDAVTKDSASGWACGGAGERAMSLRRVRDNAPYPRKRADL